jgi:2-polyprenyl-6-methoxyphenol hydroxylase-like FAD-dependent oxidoreductase
MRRKTVLICGAGIAGPTLAFWLRAGGFEPTLIERAPGLRSGGYVVDFWGLGYEVAQRMGLATDINRVGYHVREMRIVSDRGRRVAGFGTSVFDELTDGRFITLARSDLSQILFERISGNTQVMFGEEIIGLEDHADGVQVRFKHAEERCFDLVVGADGLHSQVRRLRFGSQERFEKPLGYFVAAFELSGYRPRNDDVYVMHGEPGRMFGRFALHDDRTLFLFVFTADFDATSVLSDIKAQRTLLRSRYGEGDSECARAVDRLGAQRLYFDRVSQIRMQSWSQGRIALIGDAAFCPSLAAGQGAALAMTAAYVLAGELTRSGGAHVEAFERYESLLRPFITAKQSSAERLAAAFAPRTRWGLFLRNQTIRACAIPGLARRSFGRDIVDTLKLPDYVWP